MIRLASTWAIQQSREIVNTLYHAAGSMAVFEEQPFEQRLRDIHTVAQQSQGRQLHYELVGQILLGMRAGKRVLTEEKQMPAMSLNHYTILARDLEATKDFYTDVVGLSVGDRPPLNVPWLLAILRRRADGASDRAAAEDEPIRRRAIRRKTGRLDHIAFSCEGLKDMKTNLEEHRHQI